MGLISSVFKIGAKAVKYGKRALKVAPDFLLGETSEVVGKGMRNTKGSIFTRAKNGFKALEQHVEKKSVKGNFFKRLWKGITSTPKAFKTNIKQGIKVAGRLGKSKGWGICKGIGKTLGKKMPLIGALITIAFEAPNIYRAFKDGGVGAGLKEIGGAGLELGCMATGAAIGSAICPGVGTLIGGVIGSFAGMFLRGKTYSEKMEESKEQGTEGQEELSEEDIEVLQDMASQEAQPAQGTQTQQQQESRAGEQQQSQQGEDNEAATAQTQNKPITAADLGFDFSTPIYQPSYNMGFGTSTYSNPFITGMYTSNPFTFNTNYSNSFSTEFNQNTNNTLKFKYVENP